MRRGEQLFSRGCVNCHTRGSNAKVIGPDLSRVGMERTYAEIEESITDPSARIEPGYELVEVSLHGGGSYARLRAATARLTAYNCKPSTAAYTFSRAMITRT